MDKRNYFPLAMILFAFGIMLWACFQIGFFTDDFHLIQFGLLRDKHFYHLHYTPIMEKLWALAAQGGFNAHLWHVSALLITCLNAGVVYCYLHRRLDAERWQALFAASFVLLNPLGSEVVFWGCCLGYTFTLFWTLSALYAYDYFHRERKFFLGASVLVLLQIAAFISWDWSIILFPVVFFTALARHFGNLSALIKILFPVFICWLALLLLRASSSYDVRWQENSAFQMLRFLGGAPLIGFFPQIKKSFLLSLGGLATAAIFYFVCIWNCRRVEVLGWIAAFFASTIPWVLFGNPCARYFYLSMPFLYIAFVLSVVHSKRNKISYTILSLFLVLQFFWMGQRIEMWFRSYKEAEKIKVQLVELSKRHEKFFVLNLPEAYGSSDLFMRPQLWFTGIQCFVPNLQQVRIKGGEYIWQGGEGLLERSEVLFSQFGESVYEVVDKNNPEPLSFEIVQLQ